MCLLVFLQKYSNHLSYVSMDMRNPATKVLKVGMFENEVLEGRISKLLKLAGNENRKQLV